jgi:hypothetical protein
MGEYIPRAPVNDEARKYNQNLPGMGGVFNTVNLHVYHYAGNNPVRYTDPDGRSPETMWMQLNGNEGGSRRLTQLNKLKDFAANIVDTGTLNGIDLVLEKPGDGCFARAAIIAEGLLQAGFDVSYEFIDKPYGGGNWNYHIAAVVTIGDEKFVVDPIVYDKRNGDRGLVSLEDWISLQQPSGEFINISTVSETPLQRVYNMWKRTGANVSKLSLVEFAEKLLIYYKETDSLLYTGRELE